MSAAVHFLPWGALMTACGMETTWRLATRALHSDRRSATTCPDCRAKFTNPTDEEAAS